MHGCMHQCVQSVPVVACTCMWQGEAICEPAAGAMNHHNQLPRLALWQPTPRQVRPGTFSWYDTRVLLAAAGSGEPGTDGQRTSSCRAPTRRYSSARTRYIRPAPRWLGPSAGSTAPTGRQPCDPPCANGSCATVSQLHTHGLPQGAQATHRDTVAAGCCIQRIANSGGHTCMYALHVVPWPLPGIIRTPMEPPHLAQHCPLRVGAGPSCATRGPGATSGHQVSCAAAAWQLGLGGSGGCASRLWPILWAQLVAGLVAARSLVWWALAITVVIESRRWPAGPTHNVELQPSRGPELGYDIMLVNPPGWAALVCGAMWSSGGMCMWHSAGGCTWPLARARGPAGAPAADAGAPALVVSHIWCLVYQGSKVPRCSPPPRHGCPWVQC
jgi:hypothetical protein